MAAPPPYRVRIGVGRPPPPASSVPSGPAQAPSSRPPPPRQPPPGGSSSSPFLRPPLDPAGTLCDASDRPLLCLSLDPAGDELIVGGADHALYGFHVPTGRPTRRLYGKRHGHIDWVGCVVYLADGRVLSGGGDGKLCLWRRASSSGVRPRAAAVAVASSSCEDLGEGHASAVSKVAAVPASRLAFSSSYDGTVKLWDTQARRLLTCLDSGRLSPQMLDPVVDFAFNDTHLMTGTRAGHCHLWDLAAGRLARSIRGAHTRGQVTCVMAWTGEPSSSSLFVTGGQDGVVKAWDPRAPTACVHQLAAHATASGGTGAVSCLERAGPYLCTAGADRRVCVLDPRATLRQLQASDHHRDAVCCLLAAEEGRALFSGGADGMVLCHDLGSSAATSMSMRLTYGLRANRGAVRGMAVSVRHGALALAGDDGKAILYSFST